MQDIATPENLIEPGTLQEEYELNTPIWLSIALDIKQLKLVIIELFIGDKPTALKRAFSKLKDLEELYKCKLSSYRSFNITDGPNAKLEMYRWFKDCGVDKLQAINLVTDASKVVSQIMDEMIEKLAIQSKQEKEQE